MIVRPFVLGQIRPLTTNVDAVSGSAGNDTITGVLGDSATYSNGDNIIGGSGTDTLNLIDDDASAYGLVALDSVEVVNVRTITAGTTRLNALDWSGTTKLTNASSLAGAVLQVSGLGVSTNITVYGDTDVNVDFAGLTSGTDTASVTVVGAGSGSASTALSYSDIDLDLDGSGLLDAATINVSGSSYVNVRGGDDLRSITVSGSASYLVLKTTATDVITSLDASQLSGTNKFFLSGRNDISVVGGAGGDTFAFGTSLGASDTIDGGAGSDTISATLNNSTVRLNATAVEAASLTLGEVAGGAIDLSGAQSVTTITVDATAGASGAISGFVGGTINVADDDITDISLDTNAGATLTVNVGTATGAVALATATITDATTVSVISNKGTASNSIAELSIDNDAKSVTISAENDADLAITNTKASAATSLSITTMGSASITLTSAEAFTALQNVSITVGGSDAADFTLADGSTLFGTGRTAYDALDTVVLTARSGADILVDAMQLGTSTFSASGVGVASGYNGVVVTLTAGNGSDIAGSADLGSGMDLVATGVALELNLNAEQSGDIYIENVLLGNPHAAGSASGTGWIGSLVVSASVAQDARVNVAEVSGSGVSVSLNAVTVGASGSFIFGSGGITADGAGVTLGTITLGSAATATIGNVSASAFGAVTVVLGQSAAFNVGTYTAIDVSGSASMGAITLTLADGASAAFGAAHIDDGSGGYGATLISGNSAADIVIGAVSASSIGTTTISLGTASTATFGIRDANTQGAISVTLASGASAEFGTIRGGTAGGSVGDITVTIGSAAGMNFGIIGDGSGSIGAINITLREGGSADFGDLNATASRISDITLNVTGGASVQFDDVAASAMGTIIVSGSGAIAFGTASATTLGGIDLRNQGSGGTFSIDLSGVTNGVVVDGGRGTTTIKSGVGNDDFYLKTGLGTDSIVFTGSGQGVDTVYRFEAGTADDKISIKGSGGIVISDGSGDVLATTLGTAANVTFLSATAAGTTLLTADANLVVITHTAYASVTAMVSSIASGGDHLIGLVAGASSDAAGNLAVVWTDGTDSYVTLVSIGADNTAIDDDSYSADTLVTLNGVTAGALVAANFSFVS